MQIQEVSKVSCWQRLPHFAAVVPPTGTLKLDGDRVPVTSKRKHATLKTSRIYELGYFEVKLFEPKAASRHPDCT